MSMRIVLAVLLATLTACSGAANATLPSTSSGAGHSSAPDHRAKGKIKIRIHVPKKHRRIRVIRNGKPEYISAATQSMSIAIAGPTTLNESVGLTPTADGCSSSLTGTFCRLTIGGLAAGTYTASISTYDGPLDGGGNTTGNLLSQAQSVGFTVNVGVVNSIGIVLGGIPTSVALIPGANATLSGNMSGFTVSKCGSDRVSVVGVDADDNYILGAGAPTPSLTSDSPTFVIASPSPSTPNGFTMTPPTAILATPGSVVHVTAGVTPNASTGGSEVTQQIPLTFGYQLCGILTQYPIPSMNSPLEITDGPDGAMWFTEYPSTIGRVTSDGAFTETPAGGGTVYGITSGPDGALWFANTNNEEIGRITTDSIITNTYPTTVAPTAITTGPYGQLWFAGQNGVGSVSTTGTVNEYPDGGIGATSIATGSDGALWFAECAASQIGRVTLSGSITEFPVPSGQSFPKHLVAGPDGALWFVDSRGGLQRITTAGTFSTVSALPGSTQDPIAFSPDGTLWFEDQGSGNVENIGTDGALLTSYQLYPSGIISDIHFGPDGSLWLANTITNSIDRIQ
jgi:virginiamycin B lyase